MAKKEGFGGMKRKGDRRWGAVWSKRQAFYRAHVRHPILNPTALLDSFSIKTWASPLFLMVPISSPSFIPFSSNNFPFLFSSPLQTWNMDSNTIHIIPIPKRNQGCVNVGGLCFLQIYIYIYIWKAKIFSILVHECIT